MVLNYFIISHDEKACSHGSITNLSDGIYELQKPKKVLIPQMKLHTRSSTPTKTIDILASFLINQTQVRYMCMYENGSK